MPVYLLYGEDTFSSRHKLEEIKGRFFNANFGETNITNLEGPSLDWKQFQRACFLRPFFSPKRLVIVKNISKGKKEEIEKISQIINAVPDFTIVVFYEEQNNLLDIAFFKKLKKEKKAEKFSLMSTSELIKWVEEGVKKEEGKIEREASFRLVQIVGPNLWRASLEIKKLVSYKDGGLIKKEDVELLVKEEVSPNIFTLVDAVAKKDTKTASVLLTDLIESGENESYILSMIAYQFRNLLVVKDLEERSQPLSKAGLHPFVLSKTKSQSINFSTEKLKNIYGKILEADIHMKSGSLRPHLALDLLLAEIVS